MSRLLSPNMILAIRAGLVLTLAGVGLAIDAKVLDESTVIAGMSVQYKVVLPKDYDADKAYPAVLAFPPGGQGLDMVQFTLVRNWAGEAQRRGYIVVIPAAPNGHTFTREGALIFPEFLEKLTRDYKIKDNKFHIAGMSNGGLSAFHLAASYPQFFSTVTGFPGYLKDASPERMKALSGMCLYMHVGEMDARWRSAMQQQADEFRAKGFAVHFTVEEGEQHVIQALNGAGAIRLFEQMEETRTCRSN